MKQYPLFSIFLLDISRKEDEDISRLDSTEDTYDEIDGDSISTVNERKFFLPLITPFDTRIPHHPTKDQINDTRNKDNGTRKRGEEDGDIVLTKRLGHDTVPSRRVSRTINFASSVSPPLSDTLETIHKNVFNSTPYYCSPNNFLSLSPVLAFPFRHNELASPDAPLHTGQAVSTTTLHPLNLQTTSRNSSKHTNSEVNSRRDRISPHGIQAPPIEYQQYNPNNVILGECVTKQLQMCAEQSNDIVRNSVNVINRNTLEASNSPSQVKSTTSSFILPSQLAAREQQFPHHEPKPAESSKEKTSCPTIWRPIPQMATPVSPSVEQPYPTTPTSPYGFLTDQSRMMTTMSDIRTTGPVNQASILQVCVIAFLDDIVLLDLSHNLNVFSQFGNS